jgi:hypothetical protein
MSIARLILREIAGMFVDDEFLALAVIAVVALSAALGFGAGVAPIGVGATLLLGCVAVLTLSVLRGGRKR